MPSRNERARHFRKAASKHLRKSISSSSLRSVDRESLFGIFFHCKERERAGQPVPEEYRDFMELVEEITSGLTEVERRRLLKIAGGMSASKVGEDENCSHNAVLGSIKNMLRKNEYCRLAAKHGVLRRKKNQYK